jgi:hypothetical protein
MNQQAMSRIENALRNAAGGGTGQSPVGAI